MELEHMSSNEIGIAIALVSSICLAFILGAIYCILKNRGKICKKEKKAENPEIQIPVDM